MLTAVVFVALQPAVYCHCYLLLLGICDVIRRWKTTDEAFPLDKKFVELECRTLVHIAVSCPSLAAVHCLIVVRNIQQPADDSKHGECRVVVNILVYNI